MAKPRDDNPWKAAGMVGLMGVQVVVCTILGYLAGRWIGNIAGGADGWIIGGTLAGFALGIVSVILMIKHFLEGKDG